jgi:hypothetical protein
MPSLEDLSTDQLLARARELEQSNTLFHTLVQNPETRETVQRAIKKLNPKVLIPEIDATDRVMGALAAEREERLKLERSIQERDIKERLEKQRAHVMAAFKLSEADLAEVEKLMIREVDPIPSYNAAAEVFSSMRRSATPTPASFAPPTFEMPAKEVWGKGLGNKAALDKIALNEAFGAWNDILQGKVAGVGPAAR